MAALTCVGSCVTTRALRSHPNKRLLAWVDGVVHSRHIALPLARLHRLLVQFVGGCRNRRRLAELISELQHQAKVLLLVFERELRAKRAAFDSAALLAREGGTRHRRPHARAVAEWRGQK